MIENKICEQCDQLYFEDKYVCQACYAKLVDYKRYNALYVKAFEEIQFELLDDRPEYENIRNVKDIVNRILDEESN